MISVECLVSLVECLRFVNNCLDLHDLGLDFKNCLGFEDLVQDC